jgi:hypothetical protein
MRLSWFRPPSRRRRRRRRRRRSRRTGRCLNSGKLGVTLSISEQGLKTKGVSSRCAGGSGNARA